MALFSGKKKYAKDIEVYSGRMGGKNPEENPGEPGTYQIYNKEGQYVGWQRHYKDAVRHASAIGGKAVKVPKSKSQSATPKHRILSESEAAAYRKHHGIDFTGKKNPGALWFDSPAKRDKAAKTLRASGHSGFQRWTDNTRKHSGKPAYFLTYSGNESISTLEKILTGKKNPALKKNPEVDAAELYEAFHGKPSDRYIELKEKIHEHGFETELGDLVSLKVITVTGLDADICFENAAGEFPVKLSSSEDGKQLFFFGGDQELDLDALGMGSEEWTRDSMVIGVLCMVTYTTEKGFDNFELTDYYHQLGEETGVEPFLIYDFRNKKMSVSGGQYEVRPEGIVN